MGWGRIIKIKQLECLYHASYTQIAKCIQSNNVKSTVLKAFLILVCSKLNTITSFVCKFSKHVCVFWFHTPELSRSLILDPCLKSDETPLVTVLLSVVMSDFLTKVLHLI